MGRPGSGRKEPPPPADKCRATCSHRARNVHAQEDGVRSLTTATGKQDDYGAMVECACNVRASCLSPEAGTQGTKGTAGSHTASPPPPQSENERNQSEQGGQEGKSEQKECAPPRTSAAPRACIVLAACMLRRKGNKRPPPPPTSQEGDEGARGAEGKWGTQGVTTRPEGETGSKQWGHQAT